MWTYIFGAFSIFFPPWIFLYFDVHGEEALSNWILVYDFSSLFPFQYLSNKKWNVGLRLSECLDQNDMPMKNNIPDKMQFVSTKCWAQHNIFCFVFTFFSFFRESWIKFWIKLHLSEKVSTKEIADIKKLDDLFCFWK